MSFYRAKSTFFCRKLFCAIHHNLTQNENRNRYNGSGKEEARKGNEMVIYLDSYFFMNFLMDMLLLYITGKLGGMYIRLRRLSLGAALGGIYSCFTLVVPMQNRITLFLTAPVMGIIMVKTAYSGIHKKQFGKVIFLFYGVACLCNGIMHTAARYSSNKAVIFCLSAAAMLCVVKEVHTLFQKRILADKKYTVTLNYCGRKVVVTALIDTGNSLTEPITQRPVHIIDMRVWEKLTKELSEPEGIWAIPYHSVGKSHGILEGRTVDYMVIKGEKRETEIQKPMIAIYPGQLSGRQEYQMLLHPAAMENKEC